MTISEAIKKESVEVINPRGRIVSINGQWWAEQKENMIRKGFRLIDRESPKGAEAALVEIIEPTKPRVVMFAVYLLCGGAQRFAVMLANYLFENGWDVTVLSLVNGGGTWREIRADEKFFDLKPRAIMFNPESKALDYLTATNPDAIIWNEYNWNICRAWDLSEPVLANVYHTDGASIDVSNMPKSDIHYLVDWPDDRPIPENGYHAQNGVDLEVFKPAPKEKHEKIVVGYLGRIDANKFPDKFCKALEKFTDDRFVFEIYGGCDLAILKKIATKNPLIHLNGVVNYEHVPNVLNSFDVFMFPSMSEGCPFSVVEAMACGLPIVARDAAGTSRILPEYAKGAKTDAAILKRLKKYLDPKKREKDGIESRAIAEKNHDEHAAFGGFQSELLNRIEKRGVSVQLPVYNPPHAIFEKVLQNLSQQTYRRWVAHVVLDGADDDVAAIAKAAAMGEPRFIIHNRKHEGVAAARNFAWAMSESDVLVNQDADDPSDPKRFETIVRFFHEHPEAMAVSSQVNWCDANGNRLGGVYPNDLPQNPLNYNDIADQNLIPNPAAAFRKSAVEKIVGSKPFRCEWDGIEDYDLWLRLTKGGGEIHIIEQPLVDKCQHSEGICNVRCKNEPDAVIKLKESINNDGI